MTKVCSKCGLEKPNSEFSKNNAGKNGLRSYCKVCGNQLSAEWRKNNIQHLREYKKNRYSQIRLYLDNYRQPCVKCGESRIYLIQFHHIDPATKKFNVAGEKHRSAITVEAELRKCVCLCSNCHDEFHYFHGYNPDHPVEALKEYLGEDVFNEQCRIKGIDFTNSSGNNSCA